MSSTGNPFSSLLTTIETDLKAGVSWLEEEAAEAATALWNLLKAAFIALEPAEASILLNLLSGAVTGAAAGDSIETIATNALNSASTQEQAVFQKAGSGVAMQIIAGIKAQTTNPPNPAVVTSA